MEDFSQYLCSKDNNRLADWYWPALPRITLCERTSHHTSPPTKPHHTTRYHPGFTLGSGLPHRLQHPRHTLEAILKSYWQSQYAESHSTLPDRHLPQLPLTHTWR